MNYGSVNMSVISPEGILLVNKPIGPTSFDIIKENRKRFGIRSIGHTGTLDPFATGLLILLLGRYTRLTNFMVDQKKTYKAEILLGKSTDTDDCFGNTIQEKNVSYIEKEKILNTLKSFQGIQLQIPPIYSAISIKGERSYEKARRGEIVNHSPRFVEVFNLTIFSINYSGSTITICAELTVSKGTYIRSIARDIGKKLNIPSHLSKLNRIQIGDYHLKDVDGQLQTNINSIKGIELLSISEKNAFYLKQGRILDILSIENYKNLYNCEEKIKLAHVSEKPIGIVKIKKNQLIPVRLF